jgi:hypothetical protein
MLLCTKKELKAYEGGTTTFDVSGSRPAVQSHRLRRARPFSSSCWNSCSSCRASCSIDRYSRRLPHPSSSSMAPPMQHRRGVGYVSACGAAIFGAPYLHSAASSGLARGPVFGASLGARGHLSRWQPAPTSLPSCLLPYLVGLYDFSRTCASNYNCCEVMVSAGRQDWASGRWYPTGKASRAKAKANVRRHRLPD